MARFQYLVLIAMLAFAMQAQGSETSCFEGLESCSQDETDADALLQTKVTSNEVESASFAHQLLHGRGAQSGCDSQCTYKGHTDSCRNRVEWLHNNQQQSYANAVLRVNGDCASQCSCSNGDFGPPPAPPPPPPKPGCDSQCTYKGHTDSCRNRVEWLHKNQQQSYGAAVPRVNGDCASQCSCSEGDFGPAPTPPPTTPVPPSTTPSPTTPSPPPPTPPPTPGCDSQCTYKGHTDSCRNRVLWLKNNRQQTLLGAVQSVNNDCTAQCSCAVSDFPTPAPGSTLRVVSYNLFWWNAFGQNPWKGQRIVANIRGTLQPDILGTQEVDHANKIANEANLQVASDFAGAQGTFVSPSSGITVISKGHMDIGATGFWGPRYMTWAELSFNGRRIYHFNTHWCVRDCDENKRFQGAVNMMNRINLLTSNLQIPAILTGDFNTFTEGFTRKGPKYFLDNGFALARSNYVDAVFYSGNHWIVGQTSVGDMAGSDHAPIIAQMSLK